VELDSRALGDSEILPPLPPRHDASGDAGDREGVGKRATRHVATVHPHLDQNLAAAGSDIDDKPQPALVGPKALCDKKTHRIRVRRLDGHKLIAWPRGGAYLSVGGKATLVVRLRPGLKVHTMFVLARHQLHAWYKHAAVPVGLVQPILGKQRLVSIDPFAVDVHAISGGDQVHAERVPLEGGKIVAPRLFAILGPLDDRHQPEPEVLAVWCEGDSVGLPAVMLQLAQAVKVPAGVQLLNLRGLGAVFDVYEPLVQLGDSDAANLAPPARGAKVGAEPHELSLPRRINEQVHVRVTGAPKGCVQSLAAHLLLGPDGPNRLAHPILPVAVKGGGHRVEVSAVGRRRETRCPSLALVAAKVEQFPWLAARCRWVA
jgi:hypothetical protein